MRTTSPSSTSAPPPVERSTGVGVTLGSIFGESSSDTEVDGFLVVVLARVALGEGFGKGASACGLLRPD
jgi:hypothetical protein